jgi:enoyl-CoA hydratase/carnithine racemase
MTVSVSRSHGDAVETWWLDRPDARNAMNLEMWEEITRLASAVHTNVNTRVVVIRGRGDHFSGGADIASLGRTLAADVDGSRYREVNAAAEAALISLPVPTIAAIDGFCVGGGVQVAICCDLRYATPKAQFGVTPARLGISYPASGIQRLVNVVGLAWASELLLAGDIVDCARGLRMNLVHDVVEDLDSHLDTTIATLLSRSSFTQAAVKAILAAIESGDDTTELGHQLERASLTSGDLEEGLSAFSQKRSPQFGATRRDIS